MAWLTRMEVRDLRSLKEVQVDLHPGLNIFVGANAQGKTSLLETVAILARGRSFRTDDSASLVRHGSDGLCARGVASRQGRDTQLAVHLAERGRRLEVDGRAVRTSDYIGKLEAFVYSTDRLRVVRGPMRERRDFLDRAASAMWPAYRQTLRDYERVVRQRNAALETGAALPPWDEALGRLGAAVRQRRARYVVLLEEAVAAGSFLADERFAIRLDPQPLATEADEQAALAEQIAQAHREERRRRVTLAGPHRDRVGLLVDGHEAAETASSGQARSLVITLLLAALDVYRRERGEAAVALLDDVDSELDENRTTALCHAIAARGQALLTTAHPRWTHAVASLGRVYEVERGCVHPQ